MKQITEYTQQEVLQLTTDDIEKIIRLHLAEAGIKLPKVPVEPKYNELPEKDKKVYQISGLDMCFEKKDVADEIAQTLRNHYSTLRKISYDYKVGSQYEYDQSYDFSDYDWNHKGPEKIVVNEKRIYSTELYLQIKDKLNQNTQLENAYKKEKEEYNKISDSAKSIIDSIYETVNDIKSAQKEKERKLEVFKEYLDLSDKNVDVAWKFMNKAYTVSDEEKDYINANLPKETV